MTRGRMSAFVLVVLVSVGAVATTAPPAGAVKSGPITWHRPKVVDSAGQLAEVSCATAQRCVAADDHGNWLRYNGSSWTAPKRIAPGYDRDPWALSCPTKFFCMGLLKSRRTRPLYGSHWGPSAATRRATYDVSCADAHLCVVLDNALNVWHGSRWLRKRESKHLRLSDVSCARNFCLAGTYYGNAVTFRRGQFSTPVHLTNDNRVNGAYWGLDVACSHASFCVVYVITGPHAGETFKLVDGTWSPAGRAFRGNVPGRFITHMSCANRSLCVAASNSSVSVYDGAKWSATTRIAKGFGKIKSLSCAGRSRCVAITGDGHVVIAS